LIFYELDERSWDRGIAAEAASLSPFASSSEACHLSRTSRQDLALSQARILPRRRQQESLFLWLLLSSRLSRFSLNLKTDRSCHRRRRRKISKTGPLAFFLRSKNEIESKRNEEATF